MAINLNADPRYASITSDEGKEELEVYLQWISDNGIADTQKSFMEFVIGRFGLQDGRHLFAIWKKQMGSVKIDPKTSLQMMRFFMNPYNEPCDTEDMGPWFDFLDQVNDVVAETPAPVINRPSYKMVGVPVFFAK